MDTETVKSLTWLIVAGGLFFLMMRAGCGAHVGGGHGHHGHGDDTQHSDERDPVCGMALKPGSSSQSVVHQGKTYYFCSQTCRDKFEANPQQYTADGSGHKELHHA